MKESDITKRMSKTSGRPSSFANKSCALQPTFDVTPFVYCGGVTLTEQQFQTHEPADPFPAEPDVEVLFNQLLLSLRLLGDRELIRRAGGFEQRLERERLTAAARVAGSSGDVSSDRTRTRALLGGRERSRRSTNRDARRAATVAANPTLESKVTDGTIAADSLDALTKAANPDTGHIPDELIDQVAGLTPGQTDHAVDRYLDDTADRDHVNDRYQQQMAARRCRRGFRPAGEGKPDLATVVLEGPDAVIDRIWNQITTAADTAYQANGGRDRPAGDHLPWEHRLFDAAVEFFDGTASGGSKPAVVVSIPLDDLGTKPATQHGTGPISDDLFTQYVAGSPIYALFTNSKGKPLWLGRTRRHATVAQYLALTVRDRGCVRCGASPQRCEAHHLVPWSAPAKGRTDIDQLALLCGPCHRELHRRNHTLYRQAGPNGKPVWHTRPATPQETPPPRSATTQRE